MPAWKVGAAFSPVTDGISKQLIRAAEHPHLPASEVGSPLSAEKELESSSTKAPEVT